MNRLTSVLLLTLSFILMVTSAEWESEDHINELFSDGQSIELVSEDHPRPPRRCCFPTRLEGKCAFQSDVGAKTGMYSVDGYAPRFARDNKKQMFVLDEIVFSKKHRYNVTNIFDLKNRVAYLINRDTNKCRRAKIPQTCMQHRPCIEKDAHFMGRTWIGAGRHSLVVESWGIHKNSTKPQYNFWVMTTVEPHGCVPVGEIVGGNFNGTDVVSHISFFDLRTRIRNPKIFDIPAICKKTEEGSFSMFSHDSHQALRHL